MNDALEFSARGDELFAEIARRLRADSRRRLAGRRLLDRDRFADIRSAMCGFLGACLGLPGVPGESAVLEALLERRGAIPNYSPGALMMPHRAQTLQFNLLHRALVDALAEFDLEGVVDGIDLPVNVRVVYGETGSTEDQPYSSSKLHSDVWAGVPGDAVVCVLPVLGAIDDLTIEFGEMDRELELEWMRTLSSYDAGREVRLRQPYEDLALEHGGLYFADARLLHRTVRRRRSGVRVSIDFRFRMNDPAYRAILPPQEAGPDSADVRVPYELWTTFGRDRIMAFDDPEGGRGDARQTSLYEHRYRTVSLAPGRAA